MIGVVRAALARVPIEVRAVGESPPSSCQELMPASPVQLGVICNVPFGVGVTVSDGVAGGTTAPGTAVVPEPVPAAAVAAST